MSDPRDVSYDRDVRYTVGYNNDVGYAVGYDDVGYDVGYAGSGCSRTGAAQPPHAHVRAYSSNER